MSEIKSQFDHPVSPRVSGGAGSFDGPQVPGAGGASISDIGGSPLAQFDHTAPAPKAEVLPKQFQMARPAKRGV